MLGNDTFPVAVDGEDGRYIASSPWLPGVSVGPASTVEEAVELLRNGYAPQIRMIENPPPEVRYFYASVYTREEEQRHLDTCMNVIKTVFSKHSVPEPTFEIERSYGDEENPTVYSLTVWICLNQTLTADEYGHLDDEIFEKLETLWEQGLPCITFIPEF